MNDARTTPPGDALGELPVAERLLRAHQPRWNPERASLARAAVALFLDARRGEGMEVLMIRRAQRAGDPWSGHMAFPGGRKDAADRNTLATALRETQEEVGFDAASHATLLGRLSDVLATPRTREKTVLISPYVFRLDTVPQFAINHEVDELVQVPLRWLADRRNREKMIIEPNGVALELPCYLYGGRRIWGLSLMMLDELLDVLL